MRTAAKVDANQPDIVAGLRAIGASVLHLHELGQGAPDILVGFRGVNFLMEIKDGAKPLYAQRLTSFEEQFHDRWVGQLIVVRSLSDALRAIGVMG
jgi:hypothetical protein